MHLRSKPRRPSGLVKLLENSHAGCHSLSSKVSAGSFLDGFGMPESTITREHTHRSVPEAGRRWGRTGQARDGFAASQAGASQSAWPEGAERVGAASLGLWLSMGFARPRSGSPPKVPP